MTYADDGIVRSKDGAKIAYSANGQGDVALVFIHGGFCDRSFWVSQVEALAEEYRVVTLDLAGHGESGGRSEWTLRAFGEDARAVVEVFDLKHIVLCGHSMGGPVALDAATLMPQRVLGVIGIDTLHDAEQVLDGPLWKARIEAYRKDFKSTCENDVRRMFPDGADPKLVAQVSDKMCSGSGETAAAILEVFTGYDIGAAMQAVKAPIRSINGDLYPTNIEVNRRYAPGYEAVILSGVGHFPMLERPKELNRELAGIVGELAANRSK